MPNALLLAALLTAVQSAAAPATEPPPGPESGAVIESVEPALPAARAHLSAAARIVAVGPDSGGARPDATSDPWAVLAAESNWSRLGRVRIELAPGSQNSRNATLDADEWGVQLRPVLSPELAARYQPLPELARKRDAKGYCDGTAPIAAALTEAGRTRAAGWLEFRCALASGEARDWERSDAAFARALASVGDDGTARAAALLQRARQATFAQQWERVERMASDAMAAAPSGSVLADLALQLKPRLDVYRGRYAQALERIEPLFADLSRRRPGTLVLASLENDYALALRFLERLDESDRHYRAALEIRERLAPVAMDSAGLHMNYAMLLRARGDGLGAERQMARAIELFRAIAPDSLRLAAAYNNQALIYWDRGDLVEAERIQNQSLAIKDRLAPDSGDVAASVQNLVYLALDRGDLARAQSLAERSLAIFQRTQEGNSLGIALNLKGLVADRRGDLAAAEDAYRESVEQWKKTSPGSLRHAWSLQNLGFIAERRGELERARGLYEEALAMRHATAPGGLDEAQGLWSTGKLALLEQRYDEARKRLDAAHAIQARLAPESKEHARTLNALGHALDRLGRADEALAQLCEAERVLDLQRSRVSLSRETQAAFAARYAEVPRDCVEARVRAGDAAGALEVIERSRARALREIVAARDETLATALPPELREQRSDLARERGKAEGELAALVKDEDQAKRAEVQARIAALAQREQAWFQRLQQAAPRYARGARAQALSADQLLARLPADAVALVYAVGAERTQLVVLSGPKRTIVARSLPLGHDALEQDVRRLREHIAARQARAELDPELAAWFERVLKPAADALAGAARVVIVPDGALQTLPFAALRDGEGRYAIERWALSLTPSLSLAFEQAAASARPPQAALLGVAMPEAAAAPPGMESLGSLPALPSTRSEVEAAAGAYRGQTRVLIGAQASEAAVRAAAGRARVLHIAAHAYFDPVRPIDSGVVLSGDAARGAGDDGVVHAWEVMANWQLDAGLVVLSSCDTGLGRELANEGLIGLTRAFQYAGARRVAATLWPVSDAATAALMGDLHREIAAGVEYAQALRGAQRLALSGKLATGGGALRGVGGLGKRGEAGAVDQTHPFYWAGVELFGALP